jgi:hypothetical protein
MKMDSEALYFFLLQSGQPIAISLDELYLPADEDPRGAEPDEVVAFVRAINLIRAGGLVQIFVRTARSLNQRTVVVSDAGVKKRTVGILKGLLFPGEEISCEVKHPDDRNVDRGNFIITLSLLQKGFLPKLPRSNRSRAKK